MLTNGTYSDTSVAAANGTLPDWAVQLDLYGINIENRQIASFGRVGGNDVNYDDDIVVTFVDNDKLVVNAINGHFPAQLASDLPWELNLKLTEEAEPKVMVDMSMMSSIPGIFVVGDANSSVLSNWAVLSTFCTCIWLTNVHVLGIIRAMFHMRCGVPRGQSCPSMVSRCILTAEP